MIPLIRLFCPIYTGHSGQSCHSVHSIDEENEECHDCKHRNIESGSGGSGCNAVDVYQDCNGAAHDDNEIFFRKVHMLSCIRVLLLFLRFRFKMATSLLDRAVRSDETDEGYLEQSAGNDREVRCIQSVTSTTRALFVRRRSSL